MAVVPLRWQGASRTSQLRDICAHRSRAWLAEWSAHAEEGASFDLCGEAPRAVRPEAWAVRAGVGRLFAHVPSRFFALLGARLAGVAPACERPDAPSLAEGVGRRAFEDWMRTLLGSAVHIDRIDPADIGDACTQRHGAVHLRCDVQGLKFEFDLDAALCDALVAVRPAARAALARRIDALGPQSVSLDVVLDLGPASLIDTLSLAPGDIVKTRVPLSSVVQLQGPGGRAIAGGALAISEDRRALRITQLSTQGE